MRGRIFILSAVLLWSLGGVLAKEIHLEGVSLAFWRSLIAGLVLLPCVPIRRWVFRPVMIPLGLSFAATMGFYLASVKATTAANAIFLQCTATVWTIPISLAILRERPDRRAWPGVVLAMVGIALIVLQGRDGRPGEGRGIALGLASGVGYAAIVVGLRGLRDLDPIWLSAFNNLACGLILGAWLLASSRSIAVPEPHAWPALVAFGVLQMAIPYALFARGVRDIKAPEAALISLLEPVLNPIWVYLRHGERPADATMIGGLLLMAGVAVRYLPWPTRKITEVT
ncbi:DMT family transporter [Tundrisphaera lichenicola]|uniref:DMT family transporter n=1 Tax=Tundrisphaera lichenicola TaxID=2029860 RepID=UPI003EB9263C